MAHIYLPDVGYVNTVATTDEYDALVAACAERAVTREAAQAIADGLEAGDPVALAQWLALFGERQ